MTSSIQTIIIFYKKNTALYPFVIIIHLFQLQPVSQQKNYFYIHLSRLNKTYNTCHQSFVRIELDKCIKNCHWNGLILIKEKKHKNCTFGETH